jgi:hypothetical protein
MFAIRTGIDLMTTHFMRARSERIERGARGRQPKTQYNESVLAESAMNVKG